MPAAECLSGLAALTNAVKERGLAASGARKGVGSSTTAGRVRCAERVVVVKTRKRNERALAASGCSGTGLEARHPGAQSPRESKLPREDHDLWTWHVHTGPDALADLGQLQLRPRLPLLADPIRHRAAARCDEHKAAGCFDGPRAAKVGAPNSPHSAAACFDGSKAANVGVPNSLQSAAAWFDGSRIPDSGQSAASLVRAVRAWSVPPAGARKGLPGRQAGARGPARHAAGWLPGGRARRRRGYSGSGEPRTRVSRGAGCTEPQARRACSSARASSGPLRGEFQRCWRCVDTTALESRLTKSLQPIRWTPRPLRGWPKSRLPGSIRRKRHSFFFHNA